MGCSTSFACHFYKMQIYFPAFSWQSGFVSETFSEGHEGLLWRILCELRVIDAVILAPVAQLVEQWPFKPLALGPNPSGRTTQKPW